MSRRPAGALDRAEESIAAVALVVVVLAVGWGVFSRYVTAQPAAWAGEIATIGFAWVVFFGSVSAVRQRLHPGVDMPLDWLPPVLARLVTWTGDLLMLGFFGFMAVFGTRFALDAWSNPSPVLRMPMTVLYGPVALCSALMLVRHLQVIADRVRR